MGFLLNILKSSSRAALHCRVRFIIYSYSCVANLYAHKQAAVILIKNSYYSLADAAAAHDCPRTASKQGRKTAAQQATHPGQMPPRAVPAAQPKLAGDTAHNSPQQSSSMCSKTQSPLLAKPNTTKNVKNLTLPSAIVSKQPKVSMELPLGDPHHFVIACSKCIKCIISDTNEKLQHTHEKSQHSQGCFHNLLLVKPAKRYIPGDDQKPDPSINRVPADISKVGPKGWLLVRPRHQPMHSKKFDECEHVKLKRYCRGGGTDVLIFVYFLFTPLRIEILSFRLESGTALQTGQAHWLLVVQPKIMSISRRIIYSGFEISIFCFHYICKVYSETCLCETCVEH